MFDGLRNWASGTGYIPDTFFRDWNLRPLPLTCRRSQAPIDPADVRRSVATLTGQQHMGERPFPPPWTIHRGLEALTSERSQRFCKPMLPTLQTYG
jgi:hypothetical protein